MVVRFALALVCVVTVAGCHAGTSPELRVIGVHDSARHEVVFVDPATPDYERLIADIRGHGDERDVVTRCVLFGV